MPTKLAPNFTLEEMTFSQAAAREGIANRPGKKQIAALRALCVNVLQPLRDAVQSSITVSSGFRSPRLNKAVGGAPGSQHLEGKAADINCFALSTKALFKRVLEENLPFDQLIYEGGRQAVWVHVSFDRKQQRRQILTATFPESGGVTYTRLTRDEALAL
jgi:hypothetical protein